MGKLHLPGKLTEYTSRPLVTIDVPPAYTMGFANITIGSPIAEMGLLTNNDLVSYIEELEYEESPLLKYDKVFHFWILDRAAPGRKFGPYYVPYIHASEEKVVGEEITTEMTLRPLREVINPRLVKLNDDLYEMFFFSNFSTNELPDDEYTDDANYLIRTSEFSTNFPQRILSGRSPDTDSIIVPRDNTDYYYPDGNATFVGNPRFAALSCLIRINILEINDVYEDNSIGETVSRLYPICEKPRIIDWIDYRFIRDSYPPLMCNRTQSIDWLPSEEITNNAVLDTPAKQIPENHIITGIESKMYPEQIGYDFKTRPINDLYDNSLIYVLQIKRVGEVDPHSAEYAFDYDNFRPDATKIKIKKIEWKTLTQPYINIKRRKFGEAINDPYAYSYIEDEYRYPFDNPNTDTHFVILYIEYETVMSATLQYFLCSSSSSCDFSNCDCCYEEYELTFDYEFDRYTLPGASSCSDTTSISGTATLDMVRSEFCTFASSATFDSGDGFEATAIMTLNNLTIFTNKGNVIVSPLEFNFCCPEGDWEDFESQTIEGDCVEDLLIDNISTINSGAELNECCFEFEVVFDCTTEEWGSPSWTGDVSCECYCSTEWDIYSQSETECVYRKWVKSGSCVDSADCADNPTPLVTDVPEDNLLSLCDCRPCQCQDIEFTFREFYQEGVISLNPEYTDTSYYSYDPCFFCKTKDVDPCEICKVIDPDGIEYWAKPTSPGVCPDVYIVAGEGSNYIEDYNGCRHTLTALEQINPSESNLVSIFSDPKIDFCSKYSITATKSLKDLSYSCGQSSSESSRFSYDGLMAPVMGRPFEAIDNSLSYKLGFFNQTLYTPLEEIGFVSDNDLVEYEEDTNDLNLQYDRILNFWMMEGGSGKKVEGPFYVPYISKSEVVGEKTKYTLKPLREVINPTIKKLDEDLYVMYFFSNFIGSSTSTEYFDDPKTLKRMNEFAVDDPRFFNSSAEIPSRLTSSSSYRLLPLDNIRNYQEDGMPEYESPRCALCACLMRISDFNVPIDSSSSSSNTIRIKYPICEKPKIIQVFDDQFSTDFVQPALVNRTQSIEWATDVFDSKYVDPRARNENPPKQMYHHDIIASIQGKMYPGYVGLEFGVKPISDIYEDSLYHVFVVEDEDGNDKYYKNIDFLNSFTSPMEIVGFEWEHSADPCSMNLPGLDVVDDPSENTPDSKTKTHYIVMRVRVSSSSSCRCECGSSSFSSLSLVANCCDGPSECITSTWDKLHPSVEINYSNCASVDYFITNMVGVDGSLVNIVGTVFIPQQKWTEAIAGVKIKEPFYVTAYGSDDNLYCLSLRSYQKMYHTSEGCGADKDWRIYMKATVSEGSGTSLENPCDCSQSGDIFGEYETNKLNELGESKIDGFVSDYVGSLLTSDGTGSMIIVWKINGWTNDCVGCREL